MVFVFGCFPACILLIQIIKQLLLTARLLTNHAVLAIWFATTFHCFLDSLFATIDWCACFVTKTAKPPPAPQPTRRLPWRFYSLGYPASWMILSTVMLPSSTVVAFQTKFSIKVSRHRSPRRPQWPSYETVLHANDCGSPSPSTSESGEQVPTRMLHLAGFGPEYASYFQQRISENLAAAKATHVYSTDDVSSTAEPTVVVPSFRFRSLPDTTRAVSLTSTTMTNWTQPLSQH